MGTVVQQCQQFQAKFLINHVSTEIIHVITTFPATQFNRITQDHVLLNTGYFFERYIKTTIQDKKGLSTSLDSNRNDILLQGIFTNRTRRNLPTSQAFFPLQKDIFSSIMRSEITWRKQRKTYKHYYQTWNSWVGGRGGFTFLLIIVPSMSDCWTGVTPMMVNSPSRVIAKIMKMSITASASMRLMTNS